MRHWAMRMGEGDEGLNKVILGDYSYGRKPRISPGDYALLYIKKEKDCHFILEGKVKYIEENVSSHESKTRYIALIDSLNKLDRPRSLEEYAFSLQRVYRLEKPENHFRRRYVSLSPGDYETIRSGKIFGARTAIGLIALAMLPKQRLQFLLSLIETRSVEEMTYEYLFHEIYRFCQYAFGFMSSYGVKSAELLEDLKKKEIIEGAAFEPILDPDVGIVQEAYSFEDIAPDCQELDSFFKKMEKSPLENLVKERQPTDFQQSVFRCDLEDQLLVLGVTS